MTSVVAQHGVEGATLALVASAAGLSIGAIQHHFGRVETMIGPSIVAIAAVLLPEMQRVWHVEGRAGEQFRSALRATFRLRNDCSFEARAWTQYLACSAHDATVHALVEPHLSVIEATVKEGLERIADGMGMLLVHPPLLSARMVLSAIEGTVVSLGNHRLDAAAAELWIEQSGRTLFSL